MIYGGSFGDCEEAALRAVKKHDKKILCSFLYVRFRSAYRNKFAIIYFLQNTSQCTFTYLINLLLLLVNEGYSLINHEV